MPSPYYTITGGTEGTDWNSTTVGTLETITFTTVGSYTITPSQSLSMSYTVVGGGGGGGGFKNLTATSGGGGGGGESSFGILLLTSGTPYTAIVGDGGSGGGVNQNGGNGVVSSFNSINASGGYGGTYNSFGNGNGGDGGGTGGGIGGVSGNVNQRRGGNGKREPLIGTATGWGGGGGAYCLGGSRGGVGYAPDGTTYLYGGGGGGFSGGDGGAGGGGKGSTSSGTPAVSGTINTGGGGGGGYYNAVSKVKLSGASGGSGVVVLSFIQPTLPPSITCFKKGSKILTNNGYIKIEDLKKGDMVKTLKSGYKKIDGIGKQDINHEGIEERIKDQLYKCSKEKYPELIEDLVITGCHSILVDHFKSEKEYIRTLDILKHVYLTEDKLRLLACIDEKTEVYEKKGKHTIYHLALENENYSTNYGIYANGLLVESCSKRYLNELSGMEKIE